MKALVFESALVARIDQRPAPVASPGHVLVAPQYVGLCATDLELFDGSMSYLDSGVATYPLVPGHEWAGIIVAIGHAVDGFKIGDRVVGECSIGCRNCETCIAGRYNLCGARSETGFFGQPGALSDLMPFPADALHTIPDGVALRSASLVEPLAVAMHAIAKFPALESNSNVLIIGGGTIGYLAVVALLDQGVNVSVLEPHTERLERALRAGARSVEPGQEFAFAIESSGSVAGFGAMIDRLMFGARGVVVGLSGTGSSGASIDQVVLKELEIVGSLGSPGAWSAAVSTLTRNEQLISELVGSVYELADVPEVLLSWSEGRMTPTGKSLVHVGGSES